MRISDWSSDVCSADLVDARLGQRQADEAAAMRRHEVDRVRRRHLRGNDEVALILAVLVVDEDEHAPVARLGDNLFGARHRRQRSEAHTSELQSLMRTSYAVFCLKKKTIIHISYNNKQSN